MAALPGLTAIAACGGQEQPSRSASNTAAASSAPLTREERRAFDDSEQAIERYCGHVALAATGQRKPPTPAEQERAFAAVDELGELVAEKPAAEVETGVDARLFLSDLAEDMEGANCDSRLVERIEAVLAAVPAR